MKSKSRANTTPRKISKKHSKGCKPIKEPTSDESEEASNKNSDVKIGKLSQSKEGIEVKE